MLINPYLFGNASDPYFSMVKFLWHADGVHNAFGPYTPTVGTTITNTGGGAWLDNVSAAPVFGTTSWNSTGSGTRAAASATYTIGTSDFVIEGFFRTTTSANNRTLIDLRPPSTNGAYPYIRWVASGTTLRYHQSSADRITATTTFANNTWHYLACARDTSGGVSTVRLYWGVASGGTVPLLGSYVDTGVNYANTIIGIGLSAFFTEVLAGNADDIRLTVGTSRGYTGATVSIPTTAHPDS
jgi:hypothetical protein